MNLRRALIRAARSFAQGFVGVLLVSDVASVSGFADAGLLDKAAAAGIIAALSLVQNLGEDVGPAVMDSRRKE